MSRVAFASPLVAMGISSALAAQMLAPPVVVPIPNLSGFPKLMIGDTDLDGHVDVVVLDLSASIHVLRGLGNGSFRTPIVSGVGVALIADAQLLDLDGDRKLDLLVGGVLPRLRWVAGDGAGAFVAGGDLPQLSSPRVGVADVDRDGRPDLVGFGRSSMLVARGSANGPMPMVSTPFPPGMQAPIGSSGWTSVDLDDDGFDDLVLAGLFTTEVVYGDGAGGFARWQQLPQFTFLPQRWTDLDGDGDLDVVATASGVRIGRNDGGGVFSSIAVPGAAGPQLGEAATADLDGDGRAEIVSVGLGEVLVIARDANGQFAVVERHAVPAPESIDVADLDEDGRTDVVVIGTGGAFVLRNASASPRGLASYGTGTPTCRGAIGTTGSRTPNVGAADFRVLCSNAPANATGVLALGTRDLAGTALPGLDLVLHLGIGWPVAAMTSDAGGAANALLPLPGARWLAGLTLHAQSFWLADGGLGDTCSPAVAELASSRGLSITLQR